MLKIARVLVLPLFCLTAFTRVQADPNLMGQTGFINMPDGRIAPDGTWRIGVSNASPYLSGWTSVTILPRVEFSARYTRVANAPSGFGQNSGYGADKDKSFDLKLNALRESKYWPSISLGTQDFLGTQIFHADYLAMSKRFAALDVAVGVGRGRIGGGFGGIRYSPGFLKNVSLVAEYDANNYRQDPFATLSGAAQFKKGPSYGVEYKWGWLGSQLSYDSGGRTGVMVYLAIPLNRKAYIPKLDEPAPYHAPVSHPEAETWSREPLYKRRLIEALEQQDYQNISLSLSGNTVSVSLTNARISQMSRAVGRAARTVLALAPQGTREIRITYTVDDLPIATYSFFELHKLQDYFNGKITRKEFSGYVGVEYSSPYDETGTAQRETTTNRNSTTLRSESGIVYNDAGDSISYLREDTRSNRFKISPKAAIYFNDPSGFLHYELFLRATYDKHLAERLYFNAAVDATLLEDVSKVTQASNSLLPHVRTDIADYKKDSKVKLSKLLLNKFYQPDTGVYARATVGIYEQMFTGTGGQVLYVPPSGNWATDLSVDWLRQRDTFGGFGLRPYNTVTALAALHYRLPKNITVTARVGRFLAQDVGVRMEFKRRFQSGIEMGGWYTLTNGNDITSPGSPDKPYHDKGIFLTIPFDTMLTKDTQSVGGFTLAPWTRDVGQMVESPGDLYQIVEKPLILDYHDQDHLVNFGDRADDYPLPPPEPTARDTSITETAKHDTHESVQLLTRQTTWRALGLGLGVTVVSGVLDRPADDFAQRHGKGRVLHGVARVGNALPWVGLAGSGLLAFGANDARLSNTAYAALQAGTAAGLLSEAGAYVFGRTRPDQGEGSVNFHPASSVPGGGSFPSTHVAVAWAVVTPYAKEYDMPWLYGVAALTNVARVSDRRHWLSDTVGGSLLGYACGSLMWEWNRNPGRHSPQVLLDPGGGVNLAWQFQ